MANVRLDNTNPELRPRFLWLANGPVYGAVLYWVTSFSTRPMRFQVLQANQEIGCGVRSGPEDLPALHHNLIRETHIHAL